MKQLTVYGGMNDPHTLRVSALLSEMGVDVQYIDPIGGAAKSIGFDPSFPEVISTVRFKDRSLGCLSTDNSLIWLRSKRVLHYIRDEADQAHYFAKSENSTFIIGLIKTFNIPSFNQYLSTLCHENKIIQITSAKNVGFDVPRTIVTSNKDSVLDFIDSVESAIVKPLKMNLVPPPLSNPDSLMSILVNVVDRDEIMNASHEEIGAAPAIYQEYIEKKYELRVICFGEDVLAYKIDSQNSKFGHIDWRRAQFEKIYSIHNIPPQVAQLCVNYLKENGLHYGVFDLVVRPDGSFVFLECNSDGQWAWLEGESDIGPISQMFAENITRLLQ